MPGEFVDTNVLLYLTSGDADRADRATSLLSNDLTVSVQVLNEIVNVTRRKFRKDWSEIRGFIADLTEILTVRPLTQQDHDEALRIVARYRLAWWDSLIVAAALAAGCDVLWSEDMHHGLVVDERLRIVNPFV